MASFENLASLDGWAFRFGDPWISDSFSRDNEALTRALQKSLSAEPTDLDSFLKPDPSPTHTPTLSGVSDHDPPAKRHRTAPLKPVKRKSRASKRSQTTFITADPANFRQMVQQVTGVRFAGLAAPAVLKPEPQRLVGRYNQGILLPTLDTSAFLVDHQQIAGGHVAGDVAVSSGFDQYTDFSHFPTLESWKVM